MAWLNRSESWLLQRWGIDKEVGQTGCMGGQEKRSSRPLRWGSRLISGLCKSVPSRCHDGLFLQQTRLLSRPGLHRISLSRTFKSIINTCLWHMCTHTHAHIQRHTPVWKHSTCGVHCRALLWILALYSELRTHHQSILKLLRLRLSDVQEGGQTLHTALMGQKDKKRKTTGDLFHRICHASPVENTNLFPELTGCNNIQPSGSKSV